MHVDFATYEENYPDIFADMHGKDDDLELTMRNASESISVTLRTAAVQQLVEILNAYLSTAEFRKHRMRKEVTPTK